MNSGCFKIVFSKRLGALVAVGEHTAASGKVASGQGSHSVASGFVGALRLTFASIALAYFTLNSTQAQTTLPKLTGNTLPQGASVNTGTASISANGAQMLITQSTDKASVNWQSFNIGTEASVNVSQPSAASVLLNRVVGNDPSQILGKLTANGQVILLNPNGVVFGKDGSVTASSFTASTFGLTDADFMAAYYKYARNGSTAAVVNQGSIETSAGGFVALIGATVTNEGTIRAPQGDVVLAAAENVTLPTELVKPQPAVTPSTVSVRMSKRVRLELDPAAVNTAVNNTESGVIVTQGGQVLMQAAALSTAVASVTHSGRIDTSAPQAGAVTVLADNGVIKVDGSITANSNGNDGQGQKRKGGDIIIGRDIDTGVLAKATDVGGARLESNQGFVETSGDVLSTTGTRVQAGEWLLDPYNITIAASGASGTAYASSFTSGADSVILASDISANLTAGTSVTIATGAGGASAGNIAINESIAKTGGGDASLTLQAHGNINVAAGKTITSDTGKLNVVFNSDSDGANGGAIVFATGAGITSNGGNITLGGGTALDGTGFATADGTSTLQGVSMYSANINAGGGNIAMKGKTAATNYTGSLSNITGLYMTGGSISTTGSGTIDLSGYNQNTDTQSKGIELASGTITGGSTGAVTITGDSRGVASSSFTYVRGALLNGTVTSTGGNINITGYGGSGVQYDNGVDIGGSVIGVGSGAINITGTAGTGGSGGNVGVNTSGSGTISSVNGDIAIAGTGGLGNGAVIRDHGVVVGGSNAISSSGSGNITITGTATNTDNGYSQGVAISTGGLRTNTGNIKVDARVPQNYQVAASITAAVASTSGNVYVRSAGGKISNSSTGTISGNNVSFENTNGSIDANGVITKGAGGASTWSGVISQIGLDLGASVTAANNLNIYGNQTGSDAGVKMSGASTTVSGKNVTLYGNSSTGNGVLLSGATLSGAYINVTGATNTGYTGFAWSGGNINTTGTAGTSTNSTVKGTSAASTTASNGYGAFMMFANGSTNAANGTTLTLAGEATTLTTGQNTKERGILVQGGYTLAASGDITLDGSSKSSEGIAFGGIINMATVVGVTNKLTIKGTSAASSNASLNAINFSGAINGNVAISSINFIGEAKNLSGGSIDNAVNIAGAITGNGANVNVQAPYGKIVLDGAISGTNISVDNTGGSIDASTGVVTAGAGTSSYTNAVNINKALTSTGNINVLGKVATTTNTGVNLTATAPITSSGVSKTINIASNGNVANAAAIKNTGSTGTGANINLTSSSGTITGAGAIGDTTNKNESVTFTQAGTSTYDGAINAANFTKAGAGVLTLDSWVATTPATTNISNAYTVESGGLTLAPGSTLATLAPANVNVVNASTFSLATNSSSRWNNTAFNFTGGSGGGTMNLGGNPIGAASTTNTFSTTGGATNTVLGGLNANSANINFNLTAATSGTSLLEGGFAAITFTQNGQGGYGIGSSGAGGNAGTVNLSGGGNLLFKDSARATTFNINAGNVQVGDGSAATSSATATLDATNISIAAGSKLTINRAEAYSNAAAITGAGSLIQAGAGTLTLTGNSSAFAGTTTVNAGKTLAIGTGGSLGAAGSTLALADSAASLLFTEASGTSIVGSTISGAGLLSHAGAGTGVLTANNTYSGATTVSGGILQIGNATTTGTLGTANAVALSNNATLAFNRSANTTVEKTISGDGNVTANITGDLVLTSNIALTGSNTISLTASGSITETAGSLAATNLYMTATSGDIGSAGQRIQSSVNNMALTAAGDAFVTEANGVSIAANVGSLDLATTNGTLNVTAVNGITGITATGDVALSGTTDTGNGIYIGNNITASNGTVTLNGTTSSATSASVISPDAGIKSIATVSAKNITMTASATAANGGLLGYYGGGSLANFVATEQLNLTGTAAGTGNGFYSYIGTFSSGTGMSISGSSNAGQGVGLVNGITMTNGSTGNISITGTATDGTKQGIGLRGIAITNGGANTVLTAVNGVIATDSGNPAWNTGLQTNTITSNGTGSVQVIAGNGSATNSASIDGTVFTITQNINAGVQVSTSGTGNITAPKIISNGTGNVVVAAGSAIAAGTGTGGQVLTVTGNSITQNSTGKTYIYSGQASSTGVLSTLTSDFNTLYYQGSSHAVNAGFNKNYDGTPANDLTAPAGGSVSSGAKVLFRSTTKPGFTLALNDLSKQYGDVDPTNFVATSGATALNNAYAGAGGNNNFAVATSDVIAALTPNRAAGENVGTYAYTLDGSAMNTTLSAQPSLNIVKRDITLTSVTAASKQYDGGTAATINGGVFANTFNGETLNLSGAGVFADPNAAIGKTVNVTDVSTLGLVDGTGLWSNYNLTSTGSASGTGTISKAPLTMTVNNSSVYVTQLASSAPNQGFSYSGFLNGDDATVFNSMPTRSYTGGVSYPVAGTYNGTLSTSAVPTSTNYLVSVVPGNLTVTPADKLLISIGSQSSVYGSQTSANAGIATAGTVAAQYCFDASNCNAPNLVDLAVTRLSASHWKAADNTGSYVVFDTSVAGAQASGSGYIKVGNYTYTSSEIAPLSLPNGNFNGRATNGGVLTITPLAVSLASVPVSKAFDSTTTLPTAILPNTTLTASNKLSGDAVDASFVSGAYASSAASSAASFSVLGVQLSGADAANYSLANYANSTYTGTGAITASNSGGNSGGSNGGSSSGNFTAIPKPIIPTDNSSEGGGNSGDGSGSGNPYLVIPSNRPNSADRCTPNTLEDCLCETQEPRPLEGIAICYQPKKTTSTTPAKGRRS